MRRVNPCLLLLIAACTSTERGEAPEGAQSQTTPPEAAGCPSDSAVEAFLADWRERRPTLAIVAADVPMEAALCSQAKVVARLTAELGPVVGYKAGLTSPPAQERFGARAPVRGVLLRDMLLQAGTEVPANFGARPMFEADLLVEVADAGINGATSPEEVLAHLVSVIPFVELPDLAVAEGEPLNATILTAINVASRLGIMGQPVPAAQTDEFLASLADMRIRIVDQSGAELATAEGRAVLGHPLESVLWLIANGVTLSAGDYVSVGSIGPLLPTQPNQTVTVSYAGLPGDPTITARFR